MSKDIRWRLIFKYTVITLAMFVIAVKLADLIVLLMLKSEIPAEALSAVPELSGSVIAAIASALVLYELKNNDIEKTRENDINEASFIFNYNQAFISDENMVRVESLLENQTYYGYEGEIITDETRQMFINYLVYLEGLAVLIDKKVLRFESIDNLMAYRFFLIMNNEEVQKKELTVFPDYYRGCLKVYSLWKDYRKKRNYEIPNEQNDLEKWDRFKEYI